MKKHNLLSQNEKNRILNLDVIIENPNNIKYKDTDILFGNLMINGEIMLLKVVGSVCRGMNNVKYKAMFFQNKELKIKTIGFKINKVVGRCIL